MVFQLKIKNKFAKNTTSKNIGKFKSILSKVKYVAKNVVFVKKWSTDLKKEKLQLRAGKPTRRGFQSHELFNFKASPTIQSLEKKLREAFKNYLEKIPTLPINMNFGLI